MAKLPIRINAFVRKNEGNERKTLCIKRVPDDGGFWQTVTGTVEDSESFIQTIKREISEECGIVEDQIRQIEGPLYDFNWNKKGIEIREFVYAVEIDPATSIKLAPDEHDDYRWCNDEQLIQTLETDNNKKAAYKVLEYLNGNKA